MGKQINSNHSGTHFLLLHENMHLVKISKFNYLTSPLRGSTLSTIEEFVIKAENYDVTIYLLENLFGSKDMLMNTPPLSKLNIQPLRSSDVKLSTRMFDNI